MSLCFVFECVWERFIPVDQIFMACVFDDAGFVSL